MTDTQSGKERPGISERLRRVALHLEEALLAYMALFAKRTRRLVAAVLSDALRMLLILGVALIAFAVFLTGLAAFLDERMACSGAGGMIAGAGALVVLALALTIRSRRPEE